MSDDINERYYCRKQFLQVGMVLGIVLTGWYLYRANLQTILPGDPVRKDPVSTQVVNITLIMFVTIYQCSLLSKFIGWLIRRSGKNGAGK